LRNIDLQILEALIIGSIIRQEFVFLIVQANYYLIEGIG
jgi:hypothetical protein